MDSMNFPLRGARESAITTRYVGALVLPTRRSRMCTANLSNVLLENQRTERVRRSSVRGRPPRGLAAALVPSRGTQVANRGRVDHHHFASPLESDEAPRRELLGNARERLLDDDRVVLREGDGCFICHGPSLLRRGRSPHAKQTRAAEAARLLRRGRSPHAKQTRAAEAARPWPPHPGSSAVDRPSRGPHLLHDLLHLAELLQRPVPMATPSRSRGVTRSDRRKRVDLVPDVAVLIGCG